MMYPFSGPQSPVPCPPLKELTLKVCVPWSPMCSMSCLLPLLVPAVPGPLSPVPGPLSPPKECNLKGLYPMESNVFDVVSYFYLFPPSPIPRPLSPVPPQKKNDPKGVYRMESNVFDVVSLTSTCSHCTPFLVPCPRPPVPLKN